MTLRNAGGARKQTNKESSTRDSFPSPPKWAYLPTYWPADNKRLSKLTKTKTVKKLSNQFSILQQKSRPSESTDFESGPILSPHNSATNKTVDLIKLDNQFMVLIASAPSHSHASDLSLNYNLIRNFLAYIPELQEIETNFYGNGVDGSHLRNRLNETQTIWMREVLWVAWRKPRLPLPLFLIMVSSVAKSERQKTVACATALKSSRGF